MTSPCGIQSSSRNKDQQEDASLTYGASYESTYTDLSLNSCNVIVADQWIVLGKIGEGSFGEVFEVRDINTKRHYAIKRETNKIKHPQLHYENVMYDVLAGGVGIPQCHWYGQFDGFDCIVMDLLGPNLGQVRQNVSCMELDIAVELVCQMVSIVEHIHNRGVIVRDIKPDNFLFPANCHLPEVEMIESVDKYGMPITTYKKSTCRQVFNEQWGIEKPRIYAVDFGLACYWRDPETGKPHPDTKKHIRSKTGTARYASINVHKGRSHSRRDDVESIGYILLDLLLGTLPWTGIHAKNSKAGWDRMRQLKMDTFMSDLCAGLPQGVLNFVEYPRKLQFGDQPDYEKMRRFLEGCLPGGAYSDIVKSPFGGEAKSTDNYDIIQLELKQLKEKQLEEQRPREQNHGHSSIDHDNKTRSGNINDHHGLFAMDDLAHQLPATTVSSSQRKNSAASQSSYKKLLKQNKAKKVGWNTWKHDQAPWNPKTDWTNDEDTGTNLAKSWGDDKEGLGNWGALSATQPKQDNLWGNNGGAIETTWNEQPQDNPPTTQQTHHDDSWKKTDMTTENNWNETPSWGTAPLAQQTHANESWKKMDTERDWNEWRGTAHSNKSRGRGRFKSETLNHQPRQDSTRRRHVSQPHRHNQSQPVTTKPRTTPQQQQYHHQHPSDQIDGFNQVDGWQRKPGSSTWQQKGRPFDN
ncbi:kinase-like domain-containing protein [Chlamydoabsidia padenii]|nr:kinase-like domain-containing protein [Chlamydoabsidia padenii]